MSEQEKVRERLCTPTPPPHTHTYIHTHAHPHYTATCTYIRDIPTNIHKHPPTCAVGETCQSLQKESPKPLSLALCWIRACPWTSTVPSPCRRHSHCHSHRHSVARATPRPPLLDRNAEGWARPCQSVESTRRRSRSGGCLVRGGRSTWLLLPLW